jgi:hypothetical protein
MGEMGQILVDWSKSLKRSSLLLILLSVYYNLKIASVLWPNMQGTEYAAVVHYCKCPVTQQIRPQDAPEGFACFEFFLTHLFDEVI